MPGGLRCVAPDPGKAKGHANEGPSPLSTGWAGVVGCLVSRERTGKGQARGETDGDATFSGADRRRSHELGREPSRCAQAGSPAGAGRWRVRPRRGLPGRRGIRRPGGPTGQDGPEGLLGGEPDASVRVEDQREPLTGDGRPVRTDGTGSQGGKVPATGGRPARQVRLRLEAAPVPFPYLFCLRAGFLPGSARFSTRGATGTRARRSP